MMFRYVRVLHSCCIIVCLAASALGALRSLCLWLPEERQKQRYNTQYMYDPLLLAASSIS